MQTTFTAARTTNHPPLPATPHRPRSYFSFDMPSITSEDLKDLLHINNEQLGLLFSVYAFPNAVGSSALEVY